MTPNTIIIRYSELFLKSEFVRNKLQKNLADNIRNGMNVKGIEGKLTRKRGRIFVKTEKIKDMKELLTHVFGIISFSPAVKLELKDLEKFIRKNSKKLIKGNSFGVRVKRNGDHDFTSRELAAKLGQIVVDETGKEVDLEEPDTELFVEVRYKNSYVFTEKIGGPGGMPLGSQGKVNCWVNSREGLVACWLMMKRGCNARIYYKNNSPDVLDNWSYGTTLKKVKIAKADEIETDIPLVLGFNLEKDDIEKIRNYEKKISTVLTPVSAFTKDEIDEFMDKINK